MQPQKSMRITGIKISLMMGLILSFFQSLFALLRSGHFTFPAWLLSFAVSLAVSWAIGLLIPMGKLSGAVCQAAHARPGTLKAHLLQSLVSDLIFTPLITLANVLLAWNNAKTAGAPVSFWSMFLPSLGISLLIGYVLVFLFLPLCMKVATKGQPMQPPANPK